MSKELAKLMLTTTLYNAKIVSNACIRLQLVAAGFCMVSRLHAQDTDTYQPDSIYRVNKVRSRIQIDVGAYLKEKYTIEYDSVGRISERILTDESGIDPLNRIVSSYDNQGNVIGEAYYYGSIEGEKTKFVHDALGRVVKKSSTYHDGKPKTEILISYNPLVEKGNRYNREGLFAEYQLYYERPNVTYRETGKSYAANGDAESQWDYRYENTFDRDDRLVRRKLIQGNKAIQVTEYEYGPNGLLIKRTTRRNFSNFNQVELYKYEYRE